MILNNFLIICSFVASSVHRTPLSPAWAEGLHFLQLGFVSLPLLWPLPSCAMLKLRVLSFYPVLFQLDTGKETKHTVCASVLSYPPCKYGNSIVFLLPVWLELQLFSWPLLPETWVASIFWQCSWWNFRSGLLWLCGIRIITLWPIIANILPLLAVHWCGYRTISCKPLLTAVLSGESGSVHFLRNLLISMDDWWWMRTCMILEVQW